MPHVQVHGEEAFSASGESVNAILPMPLATLATDVGGVSLLNDVATLDDTMTEPYREAELEEPLPLALESSDEPSDVDALGS